MKNNLGAEAENRRTAKSDSAFRTISEAAKELGLQQHVLRFWESKFPQIKPMKRAGGRRYYRPEDLVLLADIRSLLMIRATPLRVCKSCLIRTRGSCLRKSRWRRWLKPSMVHRMKHQIWLIRQAQQEHQIRLFLQTC